MNPTVKRLFQKGEFSWDAAKLGLYNGVSVVRKFGASTLDGTMHPVTYDDVYNTPTTAVSLEVLSGSGDDAVAGVGAQVVTIIGLDANWNECSQDVELNGVGAVAVPTPLLRMYRWFVKRSGVYATQTAGSHVGVLTIRVSGGGATWSTLPIAPFPAGQSQIGCYTIPKGKTGYLGAKNIFVDAKFTADAYFFMRPCADDVTTPFSGVMRLFEKEVGVVGGFNLLSSAIKGPFVGPCDVGFLGVSALGADCSVEFDILLIDD